MNILSFSANDVDADDLGEECNTRPAADFTPPDDMVRVLERRVS